MSAQIYDKLLDPQWFTPSFCSPVSRSNVLKSSGLCVKTTHKDKYKAVIWRDTKVFWNKEKQLFCDRHRAKLVSCISFLVKGHANLFYLMTFEESEIKLHMGVASPGNLK
jgi:hypothetical protein